jgi:hypothetical protein
MAADKTNTAIRRAHLSALIWIDLIPEAAQIEAKMAIEKLASTAEAEIERAFFEGQDFYRNCRKVDEYKTET